MASSSQGRGIPPVVPSAARTSTGTVILEITRLREEAETFRKKLAEYETRIDSLERAKADTKRLITSAAAQLDLQTKRNSQLESALRVVVAAVGVKLPPGILSALPPVASANADPSSAGDTVDSVQPQGAGNEPVNTPTAGVAIGVSGVSKTKAVGQPKEAIVGKAARQCLFAMYGCDHLRHYDDLCYPQVEKTHPDWPAKDGRPLLRFDFKETYNSKSNKDSFADWVAYTKRHGATHLPEAAAALARASDTAITSQCRIKFDYFKREWTRKKKFLEAGESASVLGVRKRDDDEGNDDEFGDMGEDLYDPGDENARGDSEGVDGARASEPGDAPERVPLPYPSTDKKELRSRAKGKLSARCRKRAKLTGEAAIYKEPKYDSYYTEAAQSEDEDSYELVNNKWVLREHEFRAREWEFISPEVKKIRAALDAIPEPKANVSTATRIRGPARTGIPPANRVLKWLLRAWMIDESVLAAHPEWIEDGRVVKNGTAWGDLEDPIERSAALVECLGADQPEVVAALEAGREAQQAKERALEIQGGDDLTVLASVLLS